MDEIVIDVPNILPPTEFTNVGSCTTSMDNMLMWCGQVAGNVGFLIYFICGVNLAFILIYLWRPEVIKKEMHNIMSFNFAMTAILAYIHYKGG